MEGASALLRNVLVTFRQVVVSPSAAASQRSGGPVGGALPGRAPPGFDAPGPRGTQRPFSSSPFELHTTSDQGLRLVFTMLVGSFCGLTALCADLNDLFRGGVLSSLGRSKLHGLSWLHYTEVPALGQLLT